MLLIFNIFTLNTFSEFVETLFSWRASSSSLSILYFIAATMSIHSQCFWTKNLFVFSLGSLNFRIFEPEEYLFKDIWWWPTSLGWNAGLGIPCYYCLSAAYRFFHLPPVNSVTLKKVSLFEGLDGIYLCITVSAWLCREFENLKNTVKVKRFD